jgi:four helix bundle protein
MSYRDLMVWRESILLLEKVHALARALPEEERHVLGERLMHYATMIPARIARGEAAGDRRMFLHELDAARGALFALHSLLLLAEQLGYTAHREDPDPLERAVEAIEAPLSALIAKVRRDVGVLEGTAG